MKPLWKQAFDAVEQAAAPVMAKTTASSGFAEIVKVGTKIGRDMATQSEALTRQWLHAWNLPAAGDVSYLKNQVGSLEAEVRALRKVIEDQALAPVVKKPSTTKASAKKPASKKSATKSSKTRKSATKKLAVAS